MKVLVFLFCISLLLFGCVQKQTGPETNQQQGAPSELLDETGMIEDLNDLTDLQNALNDTALEDSGIDENSFS